MITSQETFCIEDLLLYRRLLYKTRLPLSVSEFRSSAVQSGIFKSFPCGRVKRREIRKSYAFGISFAFKKSMPVILPLIIFYRFLNSVTGI